MGCFNVAGSVSNLSLGCGDPVVFIPLSPQDRRNKKDGVVTLYPETMIVSNEAARCLYEPRFLAIKGEYNDYGSIENIERDANVEYIEEYFGIDIDTFMVGVTRNFAKDSMPEGMDINKAVELSRLSGMFEHRQVYDDLVKYASEVLCNAYTEADIDLYTLERLDFVEVPEDQKAEGYQDPHDPDRYNRQFVHPNIPELIAMSDGKWTHFMNEDHKLSTRYNIEGMERLVKEWFDIELSEVADVDYFKNTTSVHLRLWKRCHAEKAYADMVALVESQYKDDPAGLAMEKRILEYTHRSILHYAKDPLQYAIGNLEMLDSAAEMLLFEAMMFSTNNHYAPAMNGEQHGNAHASRALYQSCLNIIESDLKKWEDA